MSDAIETGGPAFPIPLNPGTSWTKMEPFDGMTLRDYFAAKWLTTIVIHTGAARDCADIARDCYLMADAMIKARSAPVEK